jgi:cell division protein FtsA
MKKEEPVVVTKPVVVEEIKEVVEDTVEEIQKPEPETTEDKIKKSFFDKYIEKIKEFLDNAE